MSATDDLAMILSGKRPAGGVLQNCRMEAGGADFYGEEAILERCRAAPLDLDDAEGVRRMRLTRAPELVMHRVGKAYRDGDGAWQSSADMRSMWDKDMVGMDERSIYSSMPGLRLGDDEDDHELLRFFGERSLSEIDEATAEDEEAMDEDNMMSQNDKLDRLLESRGEAYGPPATGFARRRCRPG